MDIVEYLVKERAAEVNKGKRDGTTPVCAAAGSGHLGVLKCLVEEGKADVNKSAKYRPTPLYLVSQVGHLPSYHAVNDQTISSQTCLLVLKFV